MRIDHIRARNYRTLTDVSIGFKSNYCTLSGHNNAGKSCLVRLILNLLHDSDNAPWSFDDFTFSYGEDKTQWLEDKSPIEVTYTLRLNNADDAALIALLEKLMVQQLPGADTTILITMVVNADNNSTTRVMVGEHDLDDVSKREFLAKLKSSNNLFLHNSTQHRHEYYFGRGRPAILYDFFLSDQDRKSISEAENTLQRKVKRVARDHKEALNSMLGRLNDRYDVEFSTVDFSMSRRVPLSINLRDKNVEVPLTNWGSGTQNRTHILLSILQANRIKTRELRDNRITPIVLIEEPESFLHPSAQSEFGTVLQRLSEELAIQIIVSTHSPFMLNQSSPESNILLKRKVVRKRQLDTIAEETSGEGWMKPFADHLGIIPEEFHSWRDVIGNTKGRVLLVEGEIDKEYVLFLREKFNDRFPLPADVEIIAYGGKDALRNTTILMAKITFNDT